MSLKRYETYKPSCAEWLGDVPSHWTVRRLGYYFAERREKVSDKVFQPLSVTKAGIVPQLETAAKTDDGDNRKRVCRGDFVINSRSDRKGSSGVSALDGSVSLINTVLAPEKEVLGAFVHHLLRSVDFQEEFYRYGKGIVADLWSTNYSEMKNISFPNPPLHEQAAIVAFIDREAAKIDALVEGQRRLIALLKEKRQAVISYAVTNGLDPNAPMKDSGVEWLGKVPAHWRVVPARRLIAAVEQGWSPECEAENAESGQWGVLKAGCVNWGVFRENENKALPKTLEAVASLEVKLGDVLVSRANGSPELVGSTAFVSKSRPLLMLSDKIFRVHTKSLCDSQYFVLLFNSVSIRSQILQTISGAEGLANNLPQASLKAFACVLPPIREQRAIVTSLNQTTPRIDSLVAEAESAIALLQERRAALISAAVTGKIDVRGLAPAAAEAA